MKNSLTSKFIFISPHYDDAIGSCGCLIDLLSKKNYNVDVLTVFSQQYIGDKSKLAQDFLEFCGLEDGVIERKMENQKACSYLHANIIDFPFYDAIYRKDTHGNWLYTSFMELFGQVNEQDKLLFQALVKKIQCQYISKESYLFFPSAKGGHVDHKIVKQLGFFLKNMGYNIIFYDEFSYNNNYFYMTGLEKKKILFSFDELYTKINAVKFYKSQHSILFQNKSIEEYYINTNLIDNRWFELYYIFPEEDNLVEIISL